MINAKHSMVFHGERPLLARISTQNVIRVALEWPWGGLPDARDARARGSTRKQIDIGVARRTQMCKKWWVPRQDFYSVGSMSIAKDIASLSSI